MTIPLCRGGRDEAIGENGIEIGRWKRATRLLHPDGLTRPRIPVDPTHVTNPDKDDVSMT